jgi:hypothetical protein
MNHLKTVGIAMLAAGLTVGIFQRRGAASPHCHKVKGQISVTFSIDGCTSPVGLCTQGQITGGILAGPTQYVTASLAEGAISPDQAGYWMSYAGALTVTARRGTIVFHDNGVLDYAASGPFTELNQAVGGTGAFAGATGTVFMSGLIRPDASGFDGVVKGQLCGIDNGIDSDDDGDDD